ncbi:MAG: hypothetical protein SGPRY_004102 [Prymnesium sp.]
MSDDGGPNGLVRLRLTPREEGHVSVKLLLCTHGCWVTLRRHNQLGDTRHLLAGPLWRPSPLLPSLELLFGLDVERARALVAFGAVYLDGKRLLRPDHTLRPNAQLRLHLQPKQFRMPSAIDVVCETDEFLLCNKPPGVPVHGTIDNLHQNVLSFLSKGRPSKLLITSRLDHFFTASTTLPCSSHAHTIPMRRPSFNQQLRERSVTKEYIALVHPRPSDVLPSLIHWRDARPQLPRRLLHWMDLKSREPKRMRADSREGWHHCESELLDARAVCGVITAGSGRGSLKLFELRLRLHTGRTHQLRAQVRASAYSIRSSLFS